MAQSVWRSSAPYLLLSIAIIMGVITVALVFLICSNRKSSSSNGDSLSAIELAVHQVPIDMCPQIVVIMAGNDTPSFVAKPVSVL